MFCKSRRRGLVQLEKRCLLSLPITVSSDPPESCKCKSEMTMSSFAQYISGGHTGKVVPLATADPLSTGALMEACNFCQNSGIT